MPEWITPELWPLWCRAGPVSFSSTVIRAAGSARCSARAVARPTMPPPTTRYRRHRIAYSTARRPEKARPRVTSSAYSRSPPTGSPLASLLTVTPIGLISRAR